MQTVASGKSDVISSVQSPLLCVKCEQTLSQQRYILHDGLPYCIRCYETNFSNVCAECGILIATDSKVPTHIILIINLSANPIGGLEITSYND